MLDIMTGMPFMLMIPVLVFQLQPVQEIFTEPAKVEKFENFREMIPGTNVSFEMVAIPGGTFQYGKS